VSNQPPASNASTGTRITTVATREALGIEADRVTIARSTVAAHAKYHTTAEGADRQRALAADNAVAPEASANSDSHQEPGGNRSTNSAGADVMSSELRANCQTNAFRMPAIPSQPRTSAKIVAPGGLRMLFSHAFQQSIRRKRQY
jgi:hypothetical protein